MMCSRELGDPFRRDALKKPVRSAGKVQAVRADNSEGLRAVPEFFICPIREKEDGMRKAIVLMAVALGLGFGGAHADFDGGVEDGK